MRIELAKPIEIGDGVTITAATLDHAIIYPGKMVVLNFAFGLPPKTLPMDGLSAEGVQGLDAFLASLSVEAKSEIEDGTVTARVAEKEAAAEAERQAAIDAAKANEAVVPTEGEV